MFGIGTTEMIIIGILGILIFGNRLPKVARSVGSSFWEFKAGLDNVKQEAKTLEDKVNSEVAEINTGVKEKVNVQS